MRRLHWRAWTPPLPPAPVGRRDCEEMRLLWRDSAPSDTVWERSAVGAGAAERWCMACGVDEIGVEFIARNEAALRTYELIGYRPFLVTYMRRLREST